MSKFKISCSFTHVFFHSRILLNWKTMILERFSDLTWGPAHCTPLTRIVPRLLLLYSIPSIHNYRNVVIRTGSWTAAYVCFVYACCLYCCVNLPLVPFCMFASFACFDSVNLEGSCVAFESCNDTDWLLGLFLHVCFFCMFWLGQPRRFLCGFRVVQRYRLVAGSFLHVLIRST